MGKNRETELLKRAFGEIPAIGRVLYVLFAIAAGVATLGIVFYPLAWEDIVEASNVPGLEITYGVLGYLAVLCPCVCCAMLARDISKGESPFAAKQVRRIFLAACVLAGYTLCCFIWNPIISSVQARLGPVSAVTFSDYFLVPDLFVGFWMIVATMSMLLFAMVLNYGKTLQMLADETG